MSMADRDGFIWQDGKLVPWREATTHVLTHSLHYGTGVFEGIRELLRDARRSTTVSMTQQQAILGAFAIGVPAVLMSGFATPVENMPIVLQWMAQAIPLTHFLIIVEGSFLKAMPPGDVLASLWPLAVIALATLTMATVFVRGRLQ